MNLLVAHGAKSHKILGDVISQSAPRLNVMNLKIFHLPARLAALAIAVQAFPSELWICFWNKP